MEAVATRCGDLVARAIENSNTDAGLILRYGRISWELYGVACRARGEA